MLDLEGLTAMIQREWSALGWHESAIMRQTLREKNSSHRRTGFSQMPAGDSRRVGIQGAGEFQTEKVVIIKVRDPDGLRLHDPGRSL